MLATRACQQLSPWWMLRRLTSLSRPCPSLFRWGPPHSTVLVVHGSSEAPVAGEANPVPPARKRKQKAKEEPASSEAPASADANSVSSTKTRKQRAKKEPAPCEEPASAEAPTSADATPVTPAKKRKQKANRAEPASSEPSASADANSVPLAKKRKQKAKKDIQDVQFDCGAPVLSQSANAILNGIQLGHDHIRVIMADQGLKLHKTALKHLLTLLDVGELDVRTLLKIHDLELGPPASLTQAIIEQALQETKNKGLIPLLKQQHGAAVDAQESRAPGITQMQIDVVKELQKRQTSLGSGAADADAAAESQRPWAEQLPLLLKPAEHTRLSGYLEGKTLEEIQQPPYSRKQVSTTTAFDTLVAACKAGVKLPLDRVLHDFKLDLDAAGLSSRDILLAMSKVLDLLRRGVRGQAFYEATRAKLMEDPSTKHKVQNQETSDEMGRKLTAAQARVVYYLVMAGELEKPAEWVEQENSAEAGRVG